MRVLMKRKAGQDCITDGAGEMSYRNTRLEVL
jgi:hypothetical protein